MRWKSSRSGLSCVRAGITFTVCMDLTGARLDLFQDVESVRIL
jgi:hypothetical protein